MGGNVGEWMCSGPHKFAPRCYETVDKRCLLSLPSSYYILQGSDSAGDVDEI